MTSFFWSRRSSTKDLVLKVDELLGQLVPEEVFVAALKLEGHDEEVDTPKETNSPAVEGATEGTEGLTPEEDTSDQSDDNDNENDNEIEIESPREQSIPAELERACCKIRGYFQTWDETSADREKKMLRMAELLLRYRVLEKMLIPKVLLAMTFETRKYVGHVFRAMAVHNLHGFVALLGNQLDIMKWLVEGYKNNQTALVCGAMLRDCIAYESLAVSFLNELHGELEVLFRVTKNNSNFDIAADAFISITHLLMEHKTVTVECLDTSSDRIFKLLNSLLTTTNYVTKREALQLLAELLLDPVNFSIMQRYVASRDNLKLVMMLLREPSEALRMDAFNVFKIFVANPNKSAQVEHVLLRNRTKLLAFVSDFGNNETNRDFLQEKQLIMFALKQLADKEKMLRLPLKDSISSPTSSSSPTATLS